jgi:sugar phosphate isomerase/epimerase
MSKPKLGRRDFIKVAGASAAALGAGGLPGAEAEAGQTPAQARDEKQFPKLAIITLFSRQKLAFAAQTGYEGVVVKINRDLDPDFSDSQIDRVLAISRETQCPIISIECMDDAHGRDINHIAPDPAARRERQDYFIRCLEFGHRLGCKFVGTFSGGIPGAPLDRQAKALADAFNERYLPVCEKLGVSMGWENYPTTYNFATTPAAYGAVFSQVSSPLLGLEFDPSHFVRQYIDPYQTAWDFRDRIRGVHFKDTEITQPILQQVGIHGRGWWRYRIPGQGLMDWPKFITVLLQAKFAGGAAVEHEDRFWDEPPGNNAPEFPQARKDGFILAERFLRQYLPGRLART